MHDLQGKLYVMDTALREPLVPFCSPLAPACRNRHHVAYAEPQDAAPQRSLLFDPRKRSYAMIRRCFLPAILLAALFASGCAQKLIIKNVTNLVTAETTTG